MNYLGGINTEYPEDLIPKICIEGERGLEIQIRYTLNSPELP